MRGRKSERAGAAKIVKRPPEEVELELEDFFAKWYLNEGIGQEG